MNVRVLTRYITLNSPFILREKQKEKTKTPQYKVHPNFQWSKQTLVRKIQVL